MTNTRSSLLFSILGALFFLACRKNKDEDKTAAPPLVKTFMDITGGSAAMYEYDELKRLVSLQLISGQRTDYIYSQGATISKGYDANGTLIGTDTHELNAAGFRSKVTSSGGRVSNFEYNSNGYMTKSYYTSNGTLFVTDYYYNNTTGLLDSNRNTENGVWRSSSINKEYDMSRSYSLTNENTGILWFGRGYKHPPKQNIRRVLVGNNVQEIILNLIYEYDTKGRIIKIMTTFSNGQAPNNNLYSYTE